MKRSLIILISLLAMFVISCEDSAVREYKPEVVVEAYLIVDKPISEIRLLMAQPLFQKYDEDKYLIKNASVVISGDGQVFPLEFNYERKDGYYYPDTTYLVKENTQYKIEIKLENGQNITGSTHTPEKIEWVRKSPKFLQFPKDTIKQTSTDTINWKKVPNVLYYGINIMCLDTLNYGKYLIPATNEMNRRTFVLYNRNDERRDRKRLEMSFSALMPINHSNVVWNGFRWFGKQLVSIYALDINMVQWGVFSFNFPMYDNRLSSLKGGKGCFGSASMISDTVFLLKNQP